jgi:hypothetical protein
MQNGKSCIKFNNKLNRLRIYDIAQNYRILPKVIQVLSQNNFKILHHAQPACHFMVSGVLIGQRI